MGRGGSQHARSRELKPAREKAKLLFSQGKTPAEAARALAKEFGAIPLSTLTGWKRKVIPASPPPARPAEEPPSLLEKGFTKEDMILTTLAELRAMVTGLQTAIKSLQKEPPRCQLTWENGEAVVVCETLEDAQRMKVAMAKVCQIRVSK